MNDKDREVFEAYFRNEYADELASYPDLLDKYPSGKYKERETRVSYADFLAGIDYARKEQKELLKRCEEAFADFKIGLPIIGNATGFDFSNLLATIDDYISALHAAGIGKE